MTRFGDPGGPIVDDQAAMARALELARRGWARVHPNPMVGAVVVHNHYLVAEGWHAEFGDVHAEAMALTVAGAEAEGATLFVTLEPCAHWGKQPPCIDQIIAAKISRVVIAMADPNPAAAGGVAALEAAGIKVEMGLLRDASAQLNFRFLHSFRNCGRPFIAVKLAMSMDGMIADHRGSSRWISGPEARDWVHYQRAGHAAVAAGGATVIADDARLIPRGHLVPRLPPARVVFDRSGSLHTTHGIFRDRSDVPLYMVLGDGAAHRASDYTAAGARVIIADELGNAMEQLYLNGIDSVLVEGGGRLAGALWRAGLIDRVYQVQSPVWLGSGSPGWAALGVIDLDDAGRWSVIDRQSLGADTLLVLEPG
jgi:diaminohydroxyphosphoribosylaminopyrimidine deaminase/5-amino-6-(5-phosphoribosylamino)uracil reductase